MRTSDLHNKMTVLVGGSATQKQLLTFLLIAVSVLVFLVHAPSLSARATYLDDHLFALQNPLVQNPSWDSVKRFATELIEPSTVPGFPMPLTMVSLMVDRLMAGRYDSIRAYHRTSLMLHVANAILIGVFLYLLFGRPFIAASLALLFGVHPLSVESVCWISERKTVLAAFFALWSLIFYIRFSQYHRRGQFTACLMAYALALLSKPIAVPLPAIMLLIDHWPLNRLSRKAVTEKLPLFAIGAVAAIVIFLSQTRNAEVHLPGDYNPWHIPLILCHNIIFYLHKFFWPASLSAYYGFPSPMSLKSPAILIGVVGTCVLIPLLVFSHRRTRAPLTGWLIFFVMIFPAMGIVGVTPTIAANRYLYLPSLGFLMVLTATLKWLGVVTDEHRKVMLHTGLVAVLLITTGAETIALRRYQSQWCDTVKLHEYLLATEPNATKLNSSLGVELAARGQIEKAVEHYHRALESSPDDNISRYNLALVLSRWGPEHTTEAIKHYQKALEIEPDFTLARLNLGNLFLATGDCNEAIAQYRTIIKDRVNFVPAHYNLGRALTFSGQPAEGLKHLREALRINAGFFSARDDLAWFLATHPNEAVRDSNEAVTLAEKIRDMAGNRNARVLDILAAAYASNGQYDKAVEMAQEALTIAKRFHRSDDELVTDIQERLRLYSMSLPYWEAPRMQLDRLVAKAKKGKVETAAGTSENGDTETDK